MSDHKYRFGVRGKALKGKRRTKEYRVFPRALCSTADYVVRYFDLNNHIINFVR